MIEAEAAVEGEGSVGSAFVYERRFGPRSQIEVRIPYGWRHQRQERDPRGRESWASGLGDVTLGMKHALHHSIESGTIFPSGLRSSCRPGTKARDSGPTVLWQRRSRLSGKSFLLMHSFKLKLVLNYHSILELTTKSLVVWCWVGDSPRDSGVAAGHPWLNYPSNVASKTMP